MLGFLKVVVDAPVGDRLGGGIDMGGFVLFAVEGEAGEVGVGFSVSEKGVYYWVSVIVDGPEFAGMDFVTEARIAVVGAV